MNYVYTIGMKKHHALKVLTWSLIKENDISSCIKLAQIVHLNGKIILIYLTKGLCIKVSMAHHLHLVFSSREGFFVSVLFRKSLSRL